MAKGEVQKIKGITGRVGRPETVYVRELEFKTFYEFPNVGDAKMLYIATDEDIIYRYDEELMGYIPLGSDWQDIEFIECV